jgi:tight adherence protein B
LVLKSFRTREGLTVSPLVLMLLTFLAVALAVAGAYSILSDIFLRDRTRVSKRVDEEFRKRERERARRSMVVKNRGTLGTDLGGEEEPKPSLRQRFETMIEQSGLEMTPRRLLLITVGVGVGLGLLGTLVRQSLLFGAIVGLVGAAVPLLYVSLKRKARLAKMMSQLPDAFDLMARVIRAGQTMSQAIQSVADEFEAPIAAEFTYCYEQQNLGLSPEVALRDLARRTGLLEMKIFVLALLVQQQTGGNLAEMLEKLATVIRDRFRLRGKIQALTAEGRMQALVLLALPPGLVALLFALNPTYMGVLFDQSWILIGVAISEVLGALWIRKIVNFDF